MRVKTLSLIALSFVPAVALFAADDRFASIAPFEKIVGDYTKLDTPTWLPKSETLLFADMDRSELLRLDGQNQPELLREHAHRGTTGPDGRWYGIMDGRLVSWLPDEEPKTILKSSPGGAALSLNDLDVSREGRVYFSTLKDPEKGRLTVVDIETGDARVQWDGEEKPNLWNPNGVALSPDEKFLYVGISSYKNRKNSGVYRFPVQQDGSLDVEAGQKEKWADVKGPDGIAVDPAGNVYFTAGNKLPIYSSAGEKLAQLKIPRGSGTNLAFGGKNLKTLYVTTWEALYQTEVPIAGSR